MVFFEYVHIGHISTPLHGQYIFHNGAMFRHRSIGPNMVIFQSATMYFIAVFIARLTHAISLRYRYATADCKHFWSVPKLLSSVFCFRRLSARSYQSPIFLFIYLFIYFIYRKLYFRQPPMIFPSTSRQLKNFTVFAVRKQFCTEHYFNFDVHRHYSEFVWHANFVKLEIPFVLSGVRIQKEDKN
jgi:hypothetical protein